MNFDFNLTAEFGKLVAMLTLADMNYSINECNGGVQVKLFTPDGTKELDDAVLHDFSNGYHCGLLETYRANNCDGFETAEDVFKAWVKMYRENI